MRRGRLLRACVVAFACLAAVAGTRAAQAQANFDRPGGDYQSRPVASGDPAECARRIADALEAERPRVVYPRWCAPALALPTLSRRVVGALRRAAL